MSLFLYIYIMFIGTQVISFNDKLYQIIRAFRDREGFPVEECREYTNCDTTLKRDGMLYFCRFIEEAQIIENTHTDGEIQLVEEEQKESTTPEEERTTG